MRTNQGNQGYQATGNRQGKARRIEELAYITQYHSVSLSITQAKASFHWTSPGGSLHQQQDSHERGSMAGPQAQDEPTSSEEGFHQDESARGLL